MSKYLLHGCTCWGKKSFLPSRCIKGFKMKKKLRFFRTSLNGNNALPKHPGELFGSCVNRNTIVSIMSQKLQKQRGGVYNNVLNEKRPFLSFVGNKPLHKVIGSKGNVAFAQLVCSERYMKPTLSSIRFLRFFFPSSHPYECALALRLFLWKDISISLKICAILVVCLLTLNGGQPILLLNRHLVNWITLDIENCHNENCYCVHFFTRWKKKKCFLVEVFVNARDLMKRSVYAFFLC